MTVSIARRLQDPLAELIKIDPKNIGVGMYQVRLSASFDLVLSLYFDLILLIQHWYSERMAHVLFTDNVAIFWRILINAGMPHK